MVTEDSVLAALASVVDPAGGDLAGSRRLRSLTVRDGGVAFAIAVAPGERAALEAVRREAEAAVAQLAGVERVLAALVEEDGAVPAEGEGAAPAPGGPRRAAPHSPTGPGLVARARRRLIGRRTEGRTAGDAAPAAVAPAAGDTAPRPASPAARGRPGGAAARIGPVPGVARILAVGSGKGGVGKSTVSVNLAVALAATGWRVGLLDADIYGPSVPKLVDREAYRPRVEEGLAPVEVHGIKAMSIGFLVDPAKAVAWRGPMVTGALAQLLRDTRWGTLDCLIIDMPPGTGDIQLTLAQQTPLTGALLVTTPQDLALLDVRKAAQMFRAVNVPILGFVENMSTFLCPHCGARTDIFGHGGGEREAATEGVPFLGAVPLTLGIREAADAGRPIAADPASAEAPAYAEIAANLIGVMERREERPFPAIVFE